MNIDELSERLTTEYPIIYKSILVNGDWGIGKTYFIKQFLKDKDHMYVSLFGINSFEDFKNQIYSELNRTLGFLKKGLKKLENTNIGIPWFSLSVPYFETNITKAIENRTKSKNLIIVIDDLERKSENINFAELLGMIESIGQIKGANILLVANEIKINDNTYDDFKEKVIQKVYNIDKYSSNATKQIVKKLLESFNINAKSKNKINTIIMNFIQENEIKNLRTLEKAIIFIKFVLNNINIKELKENEFRDIVISSLAVVVENIEELYIKEERKKDTSSNNFTTNLLREQEKQLNSCIIKNYFKEPMFSSNKYNIVNPLLEIYQDKDVKENFKKINDYYKSAHCTNKKSLDTFYLAEEDLKVIIESFYNNTILNIDESLNINDWFKKFNDIYKYAEIIDMQDVFQECDIKNAMDAYIEKMEFNEGLFYILDRHEPFEIMSDKIRYYNTVLNGKITNKYYIDALEKLENLIKQDSFDRMIIERAFSIFRETNFEGKENIIKQIEENKYFIPNLNGELTETTWRLAHSIWSEMQKNRENRNQNFENAVKNLLSNSSKLGTYRIKSLNQQYRIILE